MQSVTSKYNFKSSCQGMLTNKYSQHCKPTKLHFQEQNPSWYCHRPQAHLKDLQMQTKPGYWIHSNPLHCQCCQLSLQRGLRAAFIWLPHTQ